MKHYQNMTLWFATGSQHLYGEEALTTVAEHAKIVAETLHASPLIPCTIQYKALLTTPAEITNFCIAANADNNCSGVILWMHTFSPAKMWINGLKNFSKPILHLHTQFNRDIPWDTIDMNYMNINQSAHGGREFGYIATRLNIKRKVITGFWKDDAIVHEIAAWTRSVAGHHEASTMKIARFEDNMRDVAVTEGDKVAAQIQLGYSVYGYGIGDLLTSMHKVSDSHIDEIINEYKERYEIDAHIIQDEKNMRALKESARIEIGLRNFLEEGGFTAFTTNFETLHGMKQLPGMAVQRLMEQGYGFGGEGDWKVAALVRIMKVMGQGLQGGTSFMEDYVYHFHPDGNKVLGAHMLEVCPSIGYPNTPRVAIHPLSIGGKEDPVRLIFNTSEGTAINVSMVDMGDRFRIVINEVIVETPHHDMPKLPVARALWSPMPNLKTAATTWILAGGSHHTSFSKDVSTQMLLDYADMIDIEALVIDKNTDIQSFKDTLRWNEIWNYIRR